MDVAALGHRRNVALLEAGGISVPGRIRNLESENPAGGEIGGEIR
jgi:hypothetical protein